MAKNSFKTHCNILDYIEKKDPVLHAIIRGLCAGGVFASFKGKPGITFLWPQDASFTKKLKEDAESENVDLVAKARERLYAHVIKDVFKSPAEWMSKKDDIPNSLQSSQRVEIESTSAKEVVFKSGAKAVLDTDFIDSSQKKNIAVWKLTGEIPVTADKPSTGKYLKAKGKIGAYEPNLQIMQKQRYQIGLAVENEYALSRAGGKTNRDPYCEAVLSLLYHILHIRKDIALLYDKVLPLISFSKIDFYILVEPHRLSGNFILDDVLINDWWNSRLSTRFNLKQVGEDVQKILTNSKYPAKIFSARSAVLNSIMSIRKKVLEESMHNPRKIIVCMSQFYAELEDKNTVCDVGPVYPPGLAEYYSENKGLKMIHDELRFVTLLRFANLEHGPFNIHEFSRLVNYIGDALCHESAVDKSRHQLLNRATLQYMIIPTERVEEIEMFVYSTSFMFMPMTAEECTAVKARHTVSRPKPGQPMFWNMQKAIYNQHQRILMGTDPGSAEIINLLRQLNTETIDQNLRKEIIEKFSG